MCGLIEVLMGYYGLKKGDASAQLESQIDKVNAEIDTKNNFNSNAKIKIKVNGKIKEVTKANFKADSPIIPKFHMGIPSRSTRDRYFKELKKAKLFNEKSVEKVSNLKLVISEFDVRIIESVELKKIESKDNVRKLVLYFDVEDNALPPWYMREHNKQAIIKFESILNTNPKQSDDYVTTIINVIKDCSPEEEHEKISNTVQWYKKSINRFTKQPKENDTNRQPFVADLITLDRDTEESKIKASIFIKFRDYLGYLPFTIDTQDDFLDEPSDMYQLFVNKNGYEYKLSLEITNPIREAPVTYTVTLAIYDNIESKYFGKTHDLVPKGLCDKAYKLTAGKSIESSIMKLDSKNGHSDKQFKKTMNNIDDKFSLSTPGQWIVETLKCNEQDAEKINDYQNHIDAIDSIRIIEQPDDKRPELSSITNNTYIIKLI